MGIKSKVVDFAVYLINNFWPIRNRVVIVSHDKIEDNAWCLAEYIAKNENIPTILMVPEEKIKYAESRKSTPKLEIISPINFSRKKLRNYLAVLGSKYIVVSNFYKGIPYSKRREFINLWHGVGHKDLKIPERHYELRKAKKTIATSEMTQAMFADMFKVPKESVVIAGLARNDLLLDTQKTRDLVKKEKLPFFEKYTKVVIWMPTFRRIKKEGQEKLLDVKTSSNVFNYPGFKVDRFNEILEKTNTLCIVKPHPMITNIENKQSFSNIMEIDEQWLSDHQLFLYELLACTDALITDYSSVMIDYALLDKPIFCLAEDLEEYKKNQGLYFDNYEEYIPTKFFVRQEEFFNILEENLVTDNDWFSEKRRSVRDLYFQYRDNQSCKRITESFMKNEY